MNVRQRIVAFVLLIILVSIPVADIFHHHSSEINSHFSAGTDQDVVKQFVKDQIPLCTICKFVSTQQTATSINFVSTELSLFWKEIPSVNTPYLLSAFKTLVHCWTNKGPPSLF